MPPNFEASITYQGAQSTLELAAREGDRVDDRSMGITLLDRGILQVLLVV